MILIFYCNYLTTIRAATFTNPNILFDNSDDKQHFYINCIDTATGQIIGDTETSFSAPYDQSGHLLKNMNENYRQDDINLEEIFTIKEPEIPFRTRYLYNIEEEDEDLFIDTDEEGYFIGKNGFTYVVLAVCIFICAIIFIGTIYIFSNNIGRFILTSVLLLLFCFFVVYVFIFVFQHSTS